MIDTRPCAAMDLVIVILVTLICGFNIPAITNAGGHL